MDKEEIDRNTQYKQVAVKLRDGTILNGKVNVYPKDRISDVLMSNEKTFVILVEGGSNVRTYQTIVVNKKEVVWVEPEDVLPD
jgi:small nuclear ribonucleoprotein (snRNP)-like protein